jgi:hypothetical protein
MVTVKLALVGAALLLARAVAVVTGVLPQADAVAIADPGAADPAVRRRGHDRRGARGHRRGVRSAIAA